MTIRLRLLSLTFLLVSAAASGAAATSPAAGTVLPFIDDDYARALKLARQKKVPIFAEAWAPW